MNDNPFDKITISELVKRSGVSRTAFYRNYTAKEDILWELNHAFINKLASSFIEVRNQKDSYRWYYSFFHEVRDNADTMRLLLQANLPTAPLISPEFIINRLSLTLDTEEYYHFLAWQGAFATVLINWFRDGMKEDVEYMAKLCVQLMKDIPVPKSLTSQHTLRQP